MTPLALDALDALDSTASVIGSTDVDNADNATRLILALKSPGLCVKERARGNKQEKYRGRHEKPTPQSSSR
jgi:hypothetical protein